MIDWNRVSALREEVGFEDFDEVVEIFLEEVDGEIGQLANEPGDGLAERLHFLKGSALNLGFRQFSNLCKEGELCVAEPGCVDVDALVTCYQASREEFLNEVQNRFADG